MKIAKAAVEEHIITWAEDMIAIYASIGQKRAERYINNQRRRKLRKWAEENFTEYITQQLPSARNLLSNYLQQEQREEFRLAYERSEVSQVDQDVTTVFKTIHQSQPELENDRQRGLHQWAQNHLTEFLLGVAPVSFNRQRWSQQIIPNPGDFQRPLLTYFIRHGNFVKIGTSIDVISRVKCLQTGAPERFEVMLVTETSERLLHERFDHLRSRGEWFRWCPELEEFILAAKGEPPCESTRPDN